MKLKKQNAFKKFMKVVRKKDLTKKRKVFSDLISYRKRKNLFKLLKNFKINESLFWERSKQLFHGLLRNKYQLFRRTLDDKKDLKIKK